MFLFTDAVSFLQPRQYVGINFRGLPDAEMVHVIARRDGFDLVKTWVFQPA